ncbi:hypothetical protein ACIQXQ_09400 [Peribacillus sp. NPDC097198]
MKAEEILEMIGKLENEERWMLLDEMFNMYYNNRGIPKTELDLEY